MPRRPARKNRALSANVSIYRSSRKAHTAAKVRSMMKNRQSDTVSTGMLGSSLTEGVGIYLY